MIVTANSGGILSHTGDTVVVGVTAEAKKLTGSAAFLDRNCGGALSRLLAGGEFTGKFASVAILRPARGRFACVIVAGCGDGGMRNYLAALRKGFAAASAAGAKQVVCALPLCAAGVDANDALRLAAHHAVLENYRFKLGPAYDSAGIKKVIMLRSADMRVAQTAVGVAIGEGANFARHLAEQPPNICTPKFLAAQARKIGRNLRLKVRVFAGKDLEKRKMGGILAVGRASSNPPLLIVARHDGGRKGAKPVVLIGKGVTFDTGGISLKPGRKMDEMKFDMCGAAAVLGTLAAAASMKLKLNIVAVVPAAENMPGGDAYRPGDIVTMSGGKTVEILNTDAEGRLLLADALTFAQRELKPALVIDAATLTGACIVALGHHRSGMFSSDDDLADQLFSAGEESGDPCWRLPLDKEYDSLLSSDYANVPNISGAGGAGTITAACFLGRFVASCKWAHMDIAGSAWTGAKRATGRPVPLLATFLARQAGRLGG